MLVVSSVILNPAVHLDVAKLLSNLQIELNSAATLQLTENADVVDELSYKVVGQKLTELLLTDHPSIGIDFLRRVGVLKKYLPELVACKDVKQNNKYHIDDVYEHCIKVCDATPAVPSIRWAGLLHDIGKKDAFKDNNGNITFHKHEVYSTRMSRDIVSRLELDHSEEIVSLVSFHMYHYTGSLWAVVENGKEINGTRRTSIKEAEEIYPAGASPDKAEVKLVEKGWTDKTMHKFINKIGITKADLPGLSNIPLFSLRQADRLSRGLKPITEKQQDFEERITECLNRQD